MDNPISWAILFILVIYFAVKIFQKGFDELSQYQEENEKLFKN